MANVYSNNFWLLIDKTMQVSYAVIFLLTLIISFFMEVLGLPESIWKLRYHLKSGGNMILIWYWCAAKVGKEISLLRCFFEILKKITRFAAWTSCQFCLSYLSFPSCQSCLSCPSCACCPIACTNKIKMTVGSHQGIRALYLGNLLWRCSQAAKLNE